MKKPKVIELKRPPVPNEFCPECLSLKRKPNKECKNHDEYYRHQEGLAETITELSELMVKHIANKLIKVENTYSGKRHQRHWYLKAQKMLKKLMKEYKRVCGEMYNK